MVSYIFKKTILVLFFIYDRLFIYGKNLIGEEIYWGILLVFPCNYTSYLMSFLVSLAYITVNLDKINQAV